MSDISILNQNDIVEIDITDGYGNGLNVKTIDNNSNIDVEVSDVSGDNASTLHVSDDGGNVEIDVSDGAESGVSLNVSDEQGNVEVEVKEIAGEAGRGIVSITKTQTVGLVDTYTILYTDNTTSEFTVTNGQDIWGAITGTLADQTDLKTALDAKANTADLGDMAEEDDAPSNGKTYGRKDGDWSEVVSDVSWGAIGGTLANQTDLQSALNGKSNTDHTHDDRYYTESETNTLLNGKVTKTGDTMTGNLNIKNNDLDNTDTSRTAQTEKDIIFYDKNGKIVGLVGSYMGTDGTLILPITVRRFNGNTEVNNSIYLKIDKDFNRSIYVSDQQAWRTGIGAAATNHTHDDRYYTETETDSMVNVKVSKSGDIMTGGIAVKDTRVNVKQSTASGYLEKVLIQGYDVNSVNYGYVSVIYTAEGRSRIALVSRNYKNNTELVDHVLILNIDKNGTRSVTVSDQQAWRTGIGAAASSHTHDDRYYTESEIDTKLNTKLNLSGGTMTGQLLTSFKNSVAMGSRQADSNTVPNLVNELRYSSGGMGSANLGAYTSGSITIPAGWYNYIYSPHRFGGNSGAASGDNHNYGTLLLFGMTVDTNPFVIRVSGGGIASIRKITVTTS